MTKKEINRSPLFYVGDKYKLISELKTYFPKTIKRLVEPFVGGGSVFLNVKADEYLLNDIDSHVIQIHKYLCEQAYSEYAFFNNLFSIIDSYGLSCSYKNNAIPQELKTQYKKTYFAKYNKQAFNTLKENYNKSQKEDTLTLYVLLIYGFNRMLRFNKKGDYNLPVGNVDFNLNTYNSLTRYFKEVKNKSIKWHNMDFNNFFKEISFTTDDFIYLDPPYLITLSEYNKYWDEKSETNLLSILDTLDTKNIKFAISNVTNYKGKENGIFLKWSSNYNVHNIKSNYISYHDNSIKEFNEVLVTNY